MAFLINRKAPSRVECLHSLIKFLYKNYGDKSFHLDDCMFSREEDNIHNYCSLVEKTPFGLKCPYKESPLSDAGCYITNGKLEDTTKKKEVGNTINALHGMGLLSRTGHDILLTAEGKKFASIDIFTPEAAKMIQKAILSYGPVIGAIDEIENISNGAVFTGKEIEVGYPSTSETVIENGYYITISSGSTTDANTRSRSCYLSWLVSAGIIEPIGITPDVSSNIPYLKYRSFLNADSLSARKYRVVISPSEVYKQIKITRFPLDYQNLTKRTMALRENGQAAIREVTLKYEYRIQNRRFAILYLLNNSYEINKPLKYQTLYKLFTENPSFFVIEADNFDEVLKEELHIANVSGIPFKVENIKGDYFYTPKVGLNIDELSIGVPKQLLSLIKTAVNNG